MLSKFSKHQVDVVVLCQRREKTIDRGGGAAEIAIVQRRRKMYREVSGTQSQLAVEDPLRLLVDLVVGPADFRDHLGHEEPRVLQGSASLQYKRRREVVFAIVHLFFLQPSNLDLFRVRFQHVAPKKRKKSRGSSARQLGSSSALAAQVVGQSVFNSCLINLVESDALGAMENDNSPNTFAKQLFNSCFERPRLSSQGTGHNH